MIIPVVECKEIACPHPLVAPVGDRFANTPVIKTETQPVSFGGTLFELRNAFQIGNVKLRYLPEGMCM